MRGISDGDPRRREIQHSASVSHLLLICSLLIMLKMVSIKMCLICRSVLKLYWRPSDPAASGSATRRSCCPRRARRRCPRARRPRRRATCRPTPPPSPRPAPPSPPARSPPPSPPEKCITYCGYEHSCLERRTTRMNSLVLTDLI